MPLGGLVAGGYTEGDFDLADSLSVADPLPGLLASPQRDRRFLWRATPLNAAGAAVTVNVTGGSASDRGYRSLPTDSLYEQFMPGIIVPYNASLALPTGPGNFCTGWVGGTGGGASVQLANSDRLHDLLAAYNWIGRDSDIYLGPGEPDTSLANFTRISHGVTAGLEWGLDHVSVLHKDRSFLLERELQTKKYKGFGAAIRYDGVNDDASVALTCPAGSMTMEVWTRPAVAVGGTNIIANWRNGAAAGARLLYQSVTQFKFAVRNDAGTAFEATAPTAIVAGTAYQLAGVLDTVAAKVRIYVDGVLAGETAVTGTFNTVLGTLTFGKAADAASFYYNGDTDEPEIWNTARTLTQILATKDHQLLGTESGLVAYWKQDEGSGTTAANSVAAGPSLTLTGATWVGSREGDAAIAGKPKPRAYGVKRQVEPVLVDNQRLVYQINDGAVQAITAVRDSGDPITFGSDVSDIYASAPAAGTYNTCLAKGLFRMGSSPVGTVTCDFQGDNGGSLGYVSSAANIVRKMAGLVYTDPTDIDTAAVSALNTANSAVVGFYSGTEETTISNAIGVVIRSITSWGALDRLGRLTMGRVVDPATQTSTFSLAEADMREPTDGGAFFRQQANQAVKEVRVGYRHYHRVLSESEVAGAVSVTTRDDYGKEFRFVNSVSSIAPADGDVVEFLTELDTAADAQAEADRLLALWERERHLYHISPRVGVLSYFLGHVGTMTHSAYALSGGKKATVVGFVENFGDYTTPDSVELTLLLEAP